MTAEGQKIGPDGRECANRPACTSVGEGLDFSSPDIVLLFRTPFKGYVSVKQMAPAEGGLFFDQTVVSTWECVCVEGSSFEPGI